ncbi:MAG TPA: NUDIX hydrolase [Candidatus Saccharimonadales bacterium]|nr:NUDIX hydrolase [Candidatus Saccharimonadales bacterium]
MQKIVPHDAILIPEHARRVFRGQIFDVYQWPQKLYDGSEATFEMLKRPDTMIVLCIKDDNIIFVREQQPGKPEYVNLPGGRVDPGEAWDDAAKRECSEELGLEFANWRLIGVRQPVVKIEWFVVIYLATDCTEAHATKHDAGERIEPVPMSFEEAKQFLAKADDPLDRFLQTMFEPLQSIDDLKQVPSFEGKQVNR